VDLPTSDAFVTALRAIWEDGDAILPLDQRLPVAARRAIVARFGAARVIDADGDVALPEPRTYSDDDALVIATSGTTGQPKGVIHTHASLTASSRIVAAALHLGAHDHWLACLPVAHIGGFGVVARALATGARLTCVSRPDADAIAAAADAGATHTSLVPALLGRIDTSRWHTVLVGGASVPHERPANVVATYGLTETCGGVVYDSRPLGDVDVRIVDDEIQLRTPTLCRGYVDGTANVADGWLSTGDLGTWSDGLLHVSGRRDDLIITGGSKVWPQPVERILLAHPLVADAVVRGIPDETWGSIVCAWIVPRNRTSVPSLDDVRTAVRADLSDVAAPRRLIVVDSIPRTALGKPIVGELPDR
jgi:O-succinylbenzoic acid--CoA ligase